MYQCQISDNEYIRDSQTCAILSPITPFTNDSNNFWKVVSIPENKSCFMSELDDVIRSDNPTKEKLKINFWEHSSIPENKHYFTEKLCDAKSELTIMVSSFNIQDAVLEDQFKEDMINWLEKFQLLALESLLQYYNENKLLPSLLSEILELVGDVSLNDLGQVKIDLLKYIFISENLEIRHGVVEGISNLVPQFAIPILEEILKKEDSIVLKTKISSYIYQLKNL